MIKDYIINSKLYFKHKTYVNAILLEKNGNIGNYIFIKIKTKSKLNIIAYDDNQIIFDIENQQYIYLLTDIEDNFIKLHCRKKQEIRNIKINKLLKYAFNININ
jgi:hypothetical protein